MNKSTSITIRIDPDTKKQAETILSSMGMDMTTAITIYLCQVINDSAIPFRPHIDMPNYNTIKAIENVKNNANMSKSFETVSELMADLLSDED